MHFEKEDVQLLQKLVVVQIRHILNRYFRPYLEFLKKTIDEVLEKKIISKESLYTLINGVDKLKETSDPTESFVKFIIKTAATRAGLPGLVVDCLVNAGKLAYKTYKDFQNPDLDWEEFLKRLAHNAAVATATTAGGVAGTVTGAFLGSLIAPGIGTALGSAAGGAIGGALGGALGALLF